MNTVMLRLLITGAFALIALGGALALELMGRGCSPWLIALLGAVTGYFFGHVQANGFHGK